jgi:hypothetical protein
MADLAETTGPSTIAPRRELRSLLQLTTQGRSADHASSAKVGLLDAGHPPAPEDASRRLTSTVAATVKDALLRAPVLQ